MDFKQPLLQQAFLLSWPLFASLSAALSGIKIPYPAFSLKNQWETHFDWKSSLGDN